MAGETVLVVGGAGYIGSHTCLDLANKGFKPVVFDNFSNGHREFVKWGPAEEGDIRDRARLDEVLAKHKPAAILHFAALIEVGESVKDPVAFYENNVIGTLTLLAAAQAAGVKAFVFSSTCATYGLPQSVPLDETHRQVPINPYGRTKYIVEQALADYDKYTGFRSVVLRYFNAAGADFEGRIGEWHQPETHAIPLAIDAALGRREGFKVFGTDYETRDGTCVRDYIHVLDLADAHVRAVEHLLRGGSRLPSISAPARERLLRSFLAQSSASRSGRFRWNMSVVVKATRTRSLPTMTRRGKFSAGRRSTIYLRSFGRRGTGTRNQISTEMHP